MTDELLFKYISGNANPEEVLNVQEWAQNSDERKKELTRLRNVWVVAGLDAEINSFKKEAEIGQICRIIHQLNDQEQRKNHRLHFLRNAAAILLIIGLSGVAGYFISYSYLHSSSALAEIIVPRGERSTVVLPDGSIVRLNSDSHLKFASAFNSGKRVVCLEGEGFFKVKPDKSRPFIVETKSLQVEVLGTVFNVSSYPNDSVVTTFLESGKVKINRKNLDDIYLCPNEAFNYNKFTRKSQKIKMSDFRMTDWTKGILTIDRETIGELALKLERRFDIRIVFGDNEVKNHIYTGSIKDEDMNTVLEALKFASSISYQCKGDTVTLFSKR